MIETPSKDARLWATIAHLAAFVVLSGMLIFGSIIAPLVVFLLKKDEDPFIAMHAKEAVNFHISVVIYALLGIIFWIGLFFGCIAMLAAHPHAMHAEPPIWLVPILFPLAPMMAFFVALVLVAVFMIVAAVAANRGQPYRYPFTIRFIR
jgi:uncharacterized protein